MAAFFLFIYIYIIYLNDPNKWGWPFRECVGVWKSVRGLSLQEGALLSVLLRLVRFSCRLLEPVAELGMSLNICKSQTAPVSTSLTCCFMSILFQKANRAIDIRDSKCPSPSPSGFFSFAEKETNVDQCAAFPTSVCSVCVDPRMYQVWLWSWSVSFQPDNEYALYVQC